MNSQIEKLKKELEHAFNDPNSNIEDIYKISCNIDKEIEKQYPKEITKEKILELLNKDQERNIKKDIKSDLLEHYYNISPIELEILSQNIYDYCYLMSNDIIEQEIISYINTKNNEYYNQLSDEDRKKMTIEFNIKFFKSLILKYTKIFKSNKQS